MTKGNEMEKKDLLYVCLAIGIVMVMALVVKPMVTGEPVNLFGTPEAEPTEAVPATPPPWVDQTAASPTTIAPTPTPTWNGVTQNISFVDPSTYHIDLTTPRLNSTPPPSGSMPNTTWATYATIDGQWSGTTQIITIPFPYWKLDYSDITPTNEKIARFNVQVMDAQDPNRFVKIISLTYIDFRSYFDQPDLRQEQWVTTFYEGHRSYFFVINAYCIELYNLKILVPKSYV